VRDKPSMGGSSHSRIRISRRVGGRPWKLGAKLRRGKSSATGAEQSIAARLASLVCPPRLRPSVTTLAMQAVVPSGLRAPGNPPCSSLKRSDSVKHSSRSAGLRCDRNSGGLRAMGTFRAQSPLSRNWHATRGWVVRTAAVVGTLRDMYSLSILADYDGPGE